MCELNENEFISNLEDNEDPVNDTNICGKCKIKEPRIKIKSKSALCENCFLKNVRHLFRASLGSTKIVKRNSNVLVHCNGDINNICMIHMLKEAIEEPSHKRLQLNLNLVYVDECDGNSSERIARLAEFGDILKSMSPELKCFYTSLYSKEINILDVSNVTENYLESLSKAESKFTTILTSLKSETSREDYLFETRRLLLCKIAEQLECTYIFVSDIGIDLAKNLISNFVLGKGASAAHNISFCDDRVKNSSIIRPFRNLDPLEISWYAKLKELKYLNQIAKLKTNSSIQNLTSNFIDGLQKSFQSTISTVFRTGDKIAPKPVEIGVCSFCHSTLDNQHSDTLFSIEFSKFASVSANKPEFISIDNQDQILKSTVNDGDSGNLNLCHGCRNIYDDLEHKELLSYLLL
jgi:cytoplasmic tRNA 2-thiolation protein 2